MKQVDLHRIAPTEEAATMLADWMLVMDKPKWMSIITVTIVGILIAQGALYRPYRTSFRELGELVPCHPDTVKRGVKKLVAKGWVALTSSSGKAHAFTLTEKFLPLQTT
jgi:hypothetical protein